MAKKEDLRMRYLLAFAMIFVALGHIDDSYDTIFSISGLFPYYSFHIPVFLFISGYFHKTENEEHVLKYIYKKFVTLVIPFFAATLVIYLIQSLIHKFGLTLGNPFTFYNWLVEPWVKPLPNSLSIPCWYLLAFFICCVINILLRKIVSYVFKKQTAREIFLLCLYLVMGILASYIGFKAGIHSTAVVYLRCVVMLFFMQLGYFYKVCLEKYDRMSNFAFLVVVIILRYILSMLLHRFGIPLIYGLHSLELFELAGIPFFISGVIGIAFWLRICRILGDVGKKIGPLVVIGKNTKYILMFHLLGYFVFNTILYGLNHIVTVPGFETEKYFAKVYYADVWHSSLILVYLVAGLLFSLIIAYIIRWAKYMIRKTWIKKQS